MERAARAFLRCAALAIALALIYAAPSRAAAVPAAERPTAVADRPPLKPSGRPDITVSTWDSAADAEHAGMFAAVAVDDPIAPRFIWAADAAKHVVRRKSMATGLWEVVAGQEGRAGARDGPPGTSLLYRPSAICANPLGQVVVADLGNACLRLVSPSGMVSTLAGACGRAGARDGSGADALFSASVRSIVCLANCSVLVADGANGRMREVEVQDPECAAAGRRPGPSPPPSPPPPRTGGGAWGAAVAGAAGMAAVAAVALAALLHSGYLEVNTSPPHAMLYAHIPGEPPSEPPLPAVVERDGSAWLSIEEARSPAAAQEAAAAPPARAAAAAQEAAGQVPHDQAAEQQA